MGVVTQDIGGGGATSESDEILNNQTNFALDKQREIGLFRLIMDF